MLRPASRAVLLMLCAGLQAAAGDPSRELLDRIRSHMAENLARLPNYTCRETIERTAAEPGSHHFRLVDRLRLEVAYVGGRELYSWPGAASFQDVPLFQLVGGGATSTGDFAGHVRAVFTSVAPTFTPLGEEQREGHPVVRFEYRIAREKSAFAIQTGPRRMMVGYHGVIEADPESLDPQLLDIETSGLPAELKLVRTSQKIRYRRMRIGDSDFLLPTASELEMIGTNGAEDRNQTSFDACREYVGESTVRFDVDGPAARGAVAPIALPPKLRIEARLLETIDLANAARGDQVRAVVVSDVKRGGSAIVPKGAVVTGRITQIRSYSFRSANYLAVAVQFRDIEFGGRRGAFAGTVDFAGMGPDYAVGQDRASGASVISVKSLIMRLPEGTRLVLETK